MVGLTLAWAALGLSGGCTLFNDPDDNLGTPDGGLPDAAVEVELLCNNDSDDDGDSASDCDDPDCSEEPQCCERTAQTVNEDWSAPDLRTDWIFAPTEGGPWSPRRPNEGGGIVGFLPDDMPRALVSNDCIPLALGGSIESELEALDPAGCDRETVCDRFAAVVLTFPQDMAPGSRIQDELGVTLHAGGYLQVTQAGVEVFSTSITVGEAHALEIEIRPALDGQNRPVIQASLSISPSAGGAPTTFEDLIVASTEDLFSGGSCEEVPGLHLAVEGRGVGVRIGPVEASKQDCANPSQFDEQSATLTREGLRFRPSWTSAYVGAPTLASSRTPAADVQWDILVEGSNDPPELEPVAHVGYALGHARTTTDVNDDWRLDGWDSSDGPKAGDDPPSCVGGSCPERRSLREPYLLAEPNDDPVLWVLAFAREVVTGEERDRFGIELTRPPGAPDDPTSVFGDPTLIPEVVSGCVSLRDPALIPVDSEARQGYWLFFTCVGEGATPPEIQAVRVSRALEVEGGAVPVTTTVLSAEMLGAFAAEGVRAPEPVLEFVKQGARIRLWFLAQETVGEWSVGLAETAAQDADTLAFRLPAFTPFPVNPILTNDSTLVRNRCAVDEVCAISAIAVSRRSDDPERLRLLLARRVNPASGMGRDQLIPLEQTWRLP